ncbi:unnamed protein product [Phytophthora fragariaefolia]|uniref:Unnamed protein product n=1 Tax=Phytophthora fragariaefolia TaxID=1490495 RepID=A0A9W6WUQ2_9STRA|nr:unnamed protein product [Phytophthora fragariaefolia]
MILDISSGESRGYWKYHVPDKKFKQAKAVSKINNAKSTLLFDSGAEVSILDTAFARKVEQVTMGGYCEIDLGGSEKVRLRTRPSDRQKLWVTRGDRWVPTYVVDPGRPCSLRLTNVSERKLILHGDTKITMWLAGDRVPRLPGYVSVGSRRYAEWQNLAYQATTDENSVTPKQEEVQRTAVERPLYQTPTAILKGPPTCPMGTAAARQIKGRGPGIDSLHNVQDSLCNAQGLPPPSGEAGCTQIATSRAHDATNEADMCSARVLQNRGQEASNPDRRLNPSANQRRDQRRVEEGSPNPDGLGDSSDGHIHIPTDDATSTHSASVDLGNRAIDPGDEEVCIKKSGDLYVEDVAGHLAVLPEVTPTTEEVKIEDIPLIKRLLSAKIIQHSTSPWASPIVVIIKNNGFDIHLCIDYRLVNSLTRLMVYPLPLINDLLGDLDKVLWYCSLDMASGFWVVSMTDRARAVSAFITPFGLFERNRMPIGLKNQIYQRLLDNALYGFLKITKRQDHQARNARDPGRQRPIDLFQDGEPDTDKESSVLGRLSYMDDILVTAGSWEMLCERVDKLLNACDEWNLSISVAKRFWGLKKLDYLGHRISAGGMEARPKDLSSLPFPTSLSSIGQAKARLESDDQNQRDKWTRATKAFVVLKDKIVNAPILTHFDPDKRPVVILYTSKWAVSAALVQEHEGGRWAALLSNWTLEIVKCRKGEDEILGVIAASITPREEVDSILTSIAPRKQPRQVISMPPPTVGSEEELLVVSFDGSARVKRGGGAFSAIVWNLPDWMVISGASEYKANLTVNEAEYHGLLLCFDLLATQHVIHNRLIDSNLVIRQIRGEIEYKALSLKLLRQKAMEKLRSWSKHEFLHVTSQTDIDDLATLNRLAELLVPQSQISVVKIAATTRSRQRRGWEVLQEPLVQTMRMERIGRAQDEEKWIVDVKKYLTGDVNYTYKVKSVQQYVGQRVDCETGKGRPTMEGESPGNLQATYPLQIIVMDHIPFLPKSYKGNTELLIWIDLFTGYVIAKASASRTAQTIAENYEECVFRRFGASEVIRHDREPGLMADFFRSFNKIVGQKQRATMAYRPQANGTAERTVQTLTRSVKNVCVGYQPTGLGEYAERLTFALNTAQDRVRGDTPFYLMHGWDPRTTVEAMIPLGSTRRRDRELRRWRYHIQRHYQQARETVNERLRDAIQSRADRHNEPIHPYEIEVGMQVWLYLDRVKEGYARKLAHMWHGPFRVAAVVDTHAVRLEIAGTEYRLFPIVYTTKLKPVRNFPDRPKVPLVIEDQDRFDFDEALLPEDSWDTHLAEGEYEVERITDMRSGRQTRYGRTMREFLVHWKGYQEPILVDEADLNCGALLHDYLRRQANQHQFNVMQSHEEA